MVSINMHVYVYMCVLYINLGSYVSVEKINLFFKYVNEFHMQELIICKRD